MVKPHAGLPPEENWRQLPLVDACIASPPYAASLNNATDGIDWSKMEDGRRDRTKEAAFGQHGAGGIAAQAYGVTPGQLGSMPTGFIDAVIASPPYAESINAQSHGIDGARRVLPPAIDNGEKVQSMK